MLMPFCEHFIGSPRRECLGHILIPSERQLCCFVNEYVQYSNEDCPHQGICQCISEGLDPSQPVEGEIVVLIKANLIRDLGMHRVFDQVINEVCHISTNVAPCRTVDVDQFLEAVFSTSIIIAVLSREATVIKDVVGLATGHLNK